MLKTGLVNIGARLTETALRMPDAIAVVMPTGRNSEGSQRYSTRTFSELDDESNRIAAGLQAMGVRPGTRLILLVPPSINFVSLTFSIFKAGAVAVLIDPGMGRRHLLRCLQEVEPEGFVTIPIVHALRAFLHRCFPSARYHVTVGNRWYWRGRTLDELRSYDATQFTPAETYLDSPAAVIFTTGSTGPPKGVDYRHGNFHHQVEKLRDFYAIQPGEIDLPGFPLFALFNCAMGVTTVIPDMNPTRPASVNPQKIIQTVCDWKVTQAFGSPAMWNVVGQYCEDHQLRMPSLQRVLSAGAPVPPRILHSLKQAIASDGEVHTPFGATEALPVASISASEVLNDTESASRKGAGTCVGRRFPDINWKIISITDEPLESVAAARELSDGEIGELIVQGPVVTCRYVTRVENNRFSKIPDRNGFWHRMGDVGYLDPQDRFWYCGRKAHRVITEQGTLYTVPCEAVFNEHPSVFRTALVGIGTSIRQTPVLVVEPHRDKRPRSARDRTILRNELGEISRAHSHTQRIKIFMFHRSFPVDIRHNAKIFREKLAIWAERKLARKS